MWVKINDRLPKEKRYYRVMVKWFGNPNELREVNDYFNGHNFTLYRQFINEWFEGNGTSK